jgi:Cellulase (glycosyl hydrolase family 5)
MKRILRLACLAALLPLSCASSASMNPGGATEPNYVGVSGTDPQPEAILGASLASPAARGIVDRFARRIAFYLPAGSDLTALTPSFTTAAGLSVSSPAGGSPLDLSVARTVTLSDGSSYAIQAFAQTPTAAEVNAWIGTGINLGNDLDAWPGDEGSWTSGVAARKYFSDDYRKMGFDSVRIPITWGAATKSSERLDLSPPYAVNPKFMDRAEELAGWAIDAGLTVVINAHHEDWIRTKTGAALTAAKPRFEALWRQIAERFKDWPPQLVFEILNEPQGPITNREVAALNADVLGIIRASGGFNATRTVIVGPNSWNSMAALRDGSFSLPADPHIIATFHDYNPWSFAGESSGTWGSSADSAQMKADLEAVAKWAASRGVPLYMGEYGVTFQFKGRKTDLASRAAWYRGVYGAAKSLGISMAIWDDFGDFKIYDRRARSYDDSVIPTVTSK